MSRSRHLLHSGAAALAFLTLACVGDTGTVTSTIPTWTLGEPTFTVGGMAEDPRYQLFDARGAMRLSDGRVVVLNRGTSQIRYYAPDGSHLLDFGGEGDGPGEFRSIAEIDRLPGDTVLVTSRSPGFTWIGPGGERARTQIFNPFAVQVPCRIAEGGRVTLPSGMIGTRFDDNFWGPECPPQPTGIWRQSALVASVDPVAETLDTVAILGGTEREENSYRLFGHEVLLAWTEDAVYAHDTTEDWIFRIGLDGDTLAVIPRPFEEKPVPEGPVQFEAPDGTVRTVDLIKPERTPAVGRVVASTDGRLWVMAYPDPSGPLFTVSLNSSYARYGPPEGGAWQVLDDDGTPIAQLRTPPGLFVMEIGPDYLLGLHRDEFEVETIVVYPIQMGDAP